VSRPGTIITVNFATVRHDLIASLRAALFACSAALLLLLVLLLVRGASYRTRAAGLEKQVAELAVLEEKARPAIEEREQLLKNLNQMSQLVEARRASWTSLLSAVESAFPAGVALNRIEIDPPKRIVSLEGAARSPEALSSLMIGLQRAVQLKNPLLKSQSMEKETLSFHVTVNYH
jgi:Tfp pilus assembly protein PilN